MAEDPRRQAMMKLGFPDVEVNKKAIPNIRLKGSRQRLDLGLPTLFTPGLKPSKKQRAHPSIKDPFPMIKQ